ncbi:pentapeptide repeat-containing protein, partial [Micromonospora humida]|uniref:pentapeptide repeat-containing protein n=1 Tax=Micromonospora humida TaxID=2809018 RepID=UPI0033F27B9A
YAQLSSAQLSSAQLSSAQLSSAQLSSAQLSSAQLMIKLPKCRRHAGESATNRNTILRLHSRVPVDLRGCPQGGSASTGGGRQVEAVRVGRASSGHAPGLAIPRRAGRWRGDPTSGRAGGSTLGACPR